MTHAKSCEDELPEPFPPLPPTAPPVDEGIADDAVLLADDMPLDDIMLDEAAEPVELAMLPDDMAPEEDGRTTDEAPLKSEDAPLARVLA